MKKFLLSIFALMLAVFSVQAEEVTYTVTSRSEVSVSGNIPEGSSAIYNSTYNTKCQLTAGNSMTLTLKGFAGHKITGIKMSMKSNSSKGKGSFSAVVGSTTISSISDSKFNSSSWAGKWSTSYIDVTPTMSNDDYTIKENDEVVIKIAATENSLYCQSFTITYESVGGETPDVPAVETVATPVISAESTTFNEGESLIVTIETETEGAEIYYTIDGSEPVENGVIYDGEIELTETTTVKAVAKLDGWKNSEVAKATFTAIDPNATTATLSFASTVQRTSYSTTQQVWEHAGVKFTNDKTANSSDVADYAPVRLYKNSTIKIETARPISKIEFDCVSNYVISISGATTSGTIVTVNVNPANTVYELTLSAQARLNSLTVTYASGDSPEPAVTAAPALPASANFENEFEVAITAEDGAAIYYTTDGTKPTTASTVYSAPFTISETTTVKAIAVKDDVVSTVAEATYTKVKLIDLSNCTVAEAIEAYANGQKDEATITGYIVGVMVNNNVALGNITVNSNLVIADDANETDPAKCIPLQLSSGAIRNALELVNNPANLGKKIIVVGSLEAYFSRAGLKSLSSAGLYWNVTDAGYATLYLGYKAEIPSTVKAYIVESTNSTHAVLKEVEGIVAANTGLILEGEGEHLFNITSESTTADVKGNLLKGTVTSKPVEGEAYVLANINVAEEGQPAKMEIGMYKAELNKNADGNDGTTHFLNNANKAYLPIASGTALSTSLRFDFDGTTGVEKVEIRNEKEEIYDLTGRRVNEITKAGVYVVNGRKVMVK